jgi:hypothetical protein
MDFNDTSMQSWDIYEVVFAIQEVLRKRLEPELRPIIDAIGKPNSRIANVCTSSTFIKIQWV